jgi:hypothetical protein
MVNKRKLSKRLWAAEKRVKLSAAKTSHNSATKITAFEESSQRVEVGYANI